MQMYRTEKERNDLLKLAFSYHKIRPSLHVISKLTGALFFIMLAGQSEYLTSMYDNYPKTMNVFVAILAYAASNYLEDKVSRAISNFAFAVSRWKQSNKYKMLTIGSIIVLVPVFTISAVTSFSGIKGNINKGDLGLTDAQNELARIKKEANALSKPERLLKEYLTERDGLRDKILVNKATQLKSAKTDCKAAYPIKSERLQCEAENNAAIERLFSEKLDSFDVVTARTQEEKQAVITQSTAKGEKDKDKLIDMLHSQLDHKSGQIQWVASVVGWGAMFFEFFALIAAILIYSVCYECDADEEEMIKVGLKAEPTQQGIFKATWNWIVGFFLGSRP